MMKNQCIDSTRGYGTELESVLEAIEHRLYVFPNSALKEQDKKIIDKVPISVM